MNEMTQAELSQRLKELEKHATGLEKLTAATLSELDRSPVRRWAEARNNLLLNRLLDQQEGVARERAALAEEQKRRRDLQTRRKPLPKRPGEARNWERKAAPNSSGKKRGANGDLASAKNPLATPSTISAHSGLRPGGGTTAPRIPRPVNSTSANPRSHTPQRNASSVAPAKKAKRR